MAAASDTTDANTAELGSADRGNPDFAARRTKALENCQAQISFFQGAASRAHILYAVAQLVTIIVSGVIPLVLLADAPALFGASPKVVAAGLSAIVAVMAGASGAFHWQESWIRYAYFAQALTSERAKFETRATSDYSADRGESGALDTFVARIETLRMAEVAEWRAYERIQSTREASGTDDAGAKMNSNPDPAR